ncbi:hypothetical protein HYT58_02420 [Candidatus Woesearchaeota archaeon]|nr:hypothetical protein [Candidatus Woesearchaeota archaeon]
MAQKESSGGKAYGFFYLGASRQEIETELPIIRSLVSTPAQLELSLTDDMNNVRALPGLTDIVQRAEESGMNYLLTATYPDETNKRTAMEVSSILGQAEHSILCEGKGPLKGAIFYEEAEKYVRLE